MKGGQEQVRAFHLDLKALCYRDDYLRGLFPRLAALGYTHLVVEIEDKVRLEALEGATWHEAWSKERFASLLASASAAGLTPVPLIQTLGHLEFLLSRPGFHSLRETPASATMLCPSRPESLAFLRRLVAETDELFGGPPFIHLGADEARCLGRCPACRARIREKGLAAMLGGHLGEITGAVLARGRRPVIWADMVLAHPEALEELDRETILVDWDYWTGDDAPAELRVWGAGMLDEPGCRELPAGFRAGPGRYAFAADGSLRPWPYTGYLLSRGFDVWIAPALTSSGDHYFAPRFLHLANVAGAVRRMAADPRPGGLLVTSWAVRMTTIESQWPGAAIPAAADSAGPLPWSGLAAEAGRIVFGRPAPAFFRAWEKIARPLPTTHSRLGVNSHAHYYGPGRPIPEVLEELARAGALEHEATLLPGLEAGYRSGQASLAREKADADPGATVLAFWRFAARAMMIRAGELSLALDVRRGGRYSRAKAGRLLMENEVLAEDYRRLLGKIYTPAGVERCLAIVFDASRLYLSGLANG